MDGDIAGKRRQGVGLFAPQEHGHALDQDGAAHGDDDQGDGGGVLHRAQGQALKDQPHAGHQDHGAGKGQGERGDHLVDADGAQGPQHHHLALGEIDDGGGIVDDAEPQGDEGVNRAVGQAGNEILQERGKNLQGE